MAVLALDLLDAAVNIVAEWDRLLRSESAPRPLPKDINEGCGCRYGDQGQKNDYRIFSQRLISLSQERNNFRVKLLFYAMLFLETHVKNNRWQ